jgi:hypothetical protein
MFEKVSQAAERAAVGVSRREWLGLLGRGAFVAAATAAGVLASTGTAQAAIACSAASSSACVGKAQGSPCRAFRYPGVCRYAPVCVCVRIR